MYTSENKESVLIRKKRKTKIRKYNMGQLVDMHVRVLGSLSTKYEVYCLWESEYIQFGDYPEDVSTFLHCTG